MMQITIQWPTCAGCGKPTAGPRDSTEMASVHPYRGTSKHLMLRFHNNRCLGGFGETNDHATRKWVA